MPVGLKLRTIMYSNLKINWFNIDEAFDFEVLYDPVTFLVLACRSQRTGLLVHELAFYFMSFVVIFWHAVVLASSIDDVIDWTLSSTLLQRQRVCLVGSLILPCMLYFPTCAPSCFSNSSKSRWYSLPLYFDSWLLRSLTKSSSHWWQEFQARQLSLIGSPYCQVSVV